jgi:hypothetical protein
MGRRLPPGEAERRAKERARRFWSGETYATYDPTKEGFGSAAEWTAQAESLASGKGTYKRPEGAKSQARISPDLVTLGITEMPAHVDGLKAAFKKAMFVAHPDHGGTNEAARNLIDAYKRLLKFY